MIRLNALLPLVLLFTACMPSENASSQAASENVGRVWYYGFDVQRITGLPEEEIERYGCPFEITREALNGAALSERSANQPYNSEDVRAKIVIGSETVFIDRFGVAWRAGGEEFLVDKEVFAAPLVATGLCPEVR